ncbi:spore coat U domain-containing protein [Stenotrophomonas sp. HITSZ_GD]|uniref:Csu type fimbrial protein n=1 Tax=Stenotrophomonas sp. HITSZ_GD TaxID=3037248 RepID=UPI00240E28F7|nr:spore coat U domain-containing protein [Stenotrophomonas sp. HITSZ_GD]MDG2526774.1 spore coat U domain-containing protein [Stenotrophomonas sp. HITSZ_GD]
MSRGLWLALAACALWCGIVGAARADTTCTVQPSTLAFGPVTATATRDATTTFNVTCNTAGLSVLGTARVRLCLSIGDGSGGVGQYLPRRLSSGSNTLQYQIYRDSARTQVWGATGNATVPNPLVVDLAYSVPVLGGALTQQVTLYGRVPSGQSLTVGSYASNFSGAATTLQYAYNESIIGNTTVPSTCTTAITGAKTASNAFPFSVTASVAPQCSTYVTSDLDFGTVTAPAIAGNLDRTTTLGLTCTNQTAWNIGLDNGANASSSTRRMRLGSTGSYVSYELYRDSARTQRWGTTIGTDTQAGTGTGSAQTVTVYGRVPPQQPAAGSYTDTVTVTITY